MSKKSRFRGTFDKWHGKRAETLLKSERQQLYHIYSSLWRILELKKSLWAICKVWGHFVNPLTADDKYSLLNRNNLEMIFRCIYLRYKKYFVNFFLHFLNLKWILNIFKKKNTVVADIFLSLRTQKNVIR